jgi:3-oxoadipate enol-lactonase
MPETRASGCRIAYAVHGTGDTALLLIHSLGTARELFAAQSADLAARFRVLELDLRGHGESFAPDGDYALAALTADALAVLDDAGVERAHVLGLSIGGLIALDLALRAPARVERLVVANSAARIGSAELWSQRCAEVRARGLAHLPEQVLPRWLGEAFRRDHPATAERYRALLLATPARGYAGCCAALRDADLREQVRAIRAATLVVSGAEDLATPPAEGEWLAKQIGGARHWVLPTAHLSCVEQPIAFGAAVLEFLGA